MADFPLLNEASLVMIPGATKEGKVYSQVPTDGSGDFTFTRSTSATRVNEAGNIEKGYENLLLQSNSFTTTWIKSNASLTSGQSGHDGANNAWLIERTGTFGQIIQNITNSGVQTFSVYAKADSLNWIRLTQGSSNAYFDLSGSGAVGQVTQCINATIESIGGGWFKCSITSNVSLNQVRVYLANGNSDLSGTTGSIYIQDAMLNQGLVVYPYIETTTAPVAGGILEDMPRLDYSSCPALLLEPQRTNRYYHSEYIAGWGDASNVTRTANYEESPEEVDNATRLQFTGNGFLYNSPTQANATQYTLSCYAKRNDSGTQNVGFFINGSGDVDSAWSLTSEWKRFTYTYTSGNTSLAGIAGLNGADVSVYGFQMEEGSYATSYIPTYGSAVSRANDLFELRNVQTNGLVTSTQGTMFFHITDIEGTAVVYNIQTLNDLSYALRFVVRDIGFTTYQRVNNVQTIIRANHNLTLSEWKIAMSWNGTSLITSVNGTSYIDTIDASIASQLHKIARVNPQAISVTTNQILVFPTQLTEADLNTLTTL